jgi:hypothetical protein
MSGKKDTEQLLRKLGKAGIRIEKRKRSGHWCVYCPNGEQYFLSSTPSDWRALRKIKNALGKMGVPKDLLSLILDYCFIHHPPVPDDEWERFYQFKLDGYELTRPTEQLFYGRELVPSGSLIRFFPLEDYAGSAPSEPVVVLEWVEFVAKELLEPEHDIADGFGCEPWAKVLSGSHLYWVNLNLALYDFELLSSKT